MKRTVFVVALFAVLLQGCVFSPGQHMTPEDAADDIGQTGPVTVLPINAQTVAQHQNQYRPEPVPAALYAYKPGDYRIGAGDGLQITVWDHVELNSPTNQEPRAQGTQIVRNDGTVYYPFINSIQAEGKTVSELRNDLQRALSRYLTDTQVDVNVQNYASQRVVFSGSFKNAGPQVLNNVPLSLIEAVSRAGGDDGSGNLAGLILKRDGHEYMLDIDTLNRKDSKLNGIYLKNGDQLHLGNNRANKVYVLGEVNSPQVMTYGTSTFTLLEALGNAGGLSQETANAEAIYVIRGAQERAQQPATVFYLNAKKPTAFLLARQFDLQASDVVFVGPSDITRWNRFISQLLPSASVVATGNALSQ